MVTNSSPNIPTGASGTVLQGQGVGSTNAFSTATYPGTTTQYGILYSASNNVVSEIVNGTTGQMLMSTASSTPGWQRPSGICYTISSVNAQSTGQTLIFTTPAGVRFFPTSVIIISSLVTAPVTPPQVSIGTVAGSYINILPVTTLTTLTSTNLFLNIPLVVAISSISPSTAIYLDVPVAATGTAMNVNIQLIGSYL